MSIRRLLIANRGEIAIRIARGARELGISPVGVYSDADERAAFRDALDDARRIGPGPAAASYLDAAAILTAAHELGADAIHPGYGFLSERATFAAAVGAAGLTFVGPSPAAIAALGAKGDAKRHARAAGLPVVPGYDGADQNDAALRREAERLGTPLLIKASAGGGGRGMRVVDDLAAFDGALAAARREAQASFGDDAVLLERYLQRPRHIEFQILGDLHGNVVHLGERECSIQRRHQKVLEEAPSPALDPALRARMGALAIAVARGVGYTSAGTVEFLLDADGAFYFLEMNARLQVEHPITELVYGVDLVHEQLRIANGEPLRFAQEQLAPRGWAIEARLVAEDPARDDLPQAGTIAGLALPGGPGIRVDGGIRIGSEVSPYYDSLLAKIVVWAEDRPAAIARLAGALAATHLTGFATNLPLLRAIVADDAFARGATTTGFLADRTASFGLAADPARDAAAARLAAVALLDAGASWRLGGTGIPLALDDGAALLRATADRTAAGWRIRGDIIHDGLRPQGYAAVDAGGASVELDGRAYRFAFAAPPAAGAAGTRGPAGSGNVTAPMPGRIVSVAVAPGRDVAEHDLLVVLEAMKMEHRIEAPLAGRITAVHVGAGDIVIGGTLLITVGETAHG